MALIDIINDYTEGSTGSFGTAGGQSASWTVTEGNGTWTFQNYAAQLGGSWFAGFSHGDSYGPDKDQVVVTFDQQVNGVVLKLSGLNGDGNVITVSIDGVDVDLNTLIANGDVTFTPNGNAVNGAGNVEGPGGTGSDYDAATITFNIPVTSVGFQDIAGTDLALGQVLIDDTATPVAPVCFTRGTLIKTDQGERPIEDLLAGDMVLTMDHGYQPIRWIGSSKRAAIGDLAPILIRKGALGNDRDLRVSPQHRMLLQGWQAEMLFGEVEVLATAKSLLNDHSILRDEGGAVEYFHMLFDTHEIIYAEGCPSESFHPGKQGWKALDQATRDEILTLFPQLADGNFNDYGPAARVSLKHKEGKLLGSYMAGSV